MNNIFYLNSYKSSLKYHPYVCSKGTIRRYKMLGSFLSRLANINSITVHISSILFLKTKKRNVKNKIFYRIVFTFLPKSYLLFYIILVFLFQKCAQIVPLTGGKRDTSAPQLLSVHPPNYSKNFSEKKIIFSFNEKIQLINPYTNIILIPQSNKNLEWKIKNKTLEIVLPDSLQPNTTYRIILNKTIADLTEKNTLDNYEYIFSTGNFIDSFYIKGNVKDAYTLNNQKSVLIALYDESNSDSIVLKEKPFYFTKTNDEGNFIIKNLPNRKLKAFAYSDNNNNFNYDPTKEKIDHYPYPVNPDKDSILNFLITEEQPNKNNIKRTQAINPYLINIIYSYPDKYELLQNDKNIFLINDSTYSDTCKILVHNIDTAKIIVKNSTQTDSVKIPISKKSSQKLQYTLLHQFNNQQPFYSPITLQSNFWIDTNVVKKEIQFFNQADTIHSIQLNTYLKIFPHQIIINYPLQQNTSYTLKIPVKSIDSKDTIIFQTFKIKTNSSENYAQLKINILFPDKKNYIVALCNTQHKIMYSKYITLPITASNKQTIEFNNIIPDTYILKLIQDNNQNKKWDTHQNILHPSKKRFAEKIFIYPKNIKLINNWDLILDWNDVR